jgi:hypothetical protein
MDAADAAACHAASFKAMDNIKARAAACHAGFMAINAKLTDKLRTEDEEGAPDYSVASKVGGGNGEIQLEVLYAKTAEGAVGYSYQLPDGSCAKVAPATGDIITTVLAQGQLQNIKDEMVADVRSYAPASNAEEFEVCCCTWLKEFTNFSSPAQLFVGEAAKQT